MEELKQRILKDGSARVEGGGIVLVNSFLNHQLDPQLMMHCAEEFARLFKGQGINKIVTIEASGIAPAIMTGYLMPSPPSDTLTKTIPWKWCEYSQMGERFLTKRVNTKRVTLL